MSRKRLFLTVALIMLFAAAGVAGVFLLVRHEPSFYRRAAIPGGDIRKKWSNEFRSEFANELVAGIVNERHWEPNFTQTQLNAYFAEDFFSSGAGQWVPEGFSDPRVVFEQDKIRIGFRYGEGAWSTILSAHLKVWLAANEYNVIVIEVEGLYAGRLPVSSQTILEKFSEAARRQEMEVTWYRLNGHPVALLKFQAGKKDPTVQLRRFKLQDGALHVAGGPTDQRGRPLTPVSLPESSQ
jgi:hypothetical protein